MTPTFLRLGPRGAYVVSSRSLCAFGDLPGEQHYLELGRRSSHRHHLGCRWFNSGSNIGNRQQDAECDMCGNHDAPYLHQHILPVETIDHALETIKANGLQNVLALRGDPPHGQKRFVQVEGGFACARDLVNHYNLYFELLFDLL